MMSVLLVAAAAAAPFCGAVLPCFLCACVCKNSKVPPPQPATMAVERRKQRTDREDRQEGEGEEGYAIGCKRR